MAVKIKGDAAQIRWGHYCAATLGPWTLEESVLDAAIERVDLFRVNQRPLVLVVAGTTLPLESVEVSDHRVTGRVAQRG